MEIQMRFRRFKAASGVSGGLQGSRRIFDRFQGESPCFRELLGVSEGFMGKFLEDYAGLQWVFLEIAGAVKGVLGISAEFMGFQGA